MSTWTSAAKPRAARAPASSRCAPTPTPTPTASPTTTCCPTTSPGGTTIALNTFTQNYNNALMQGLNEAEARRRAYASMDPSTLKPAAAGRRARLRAARGLAVSSSTPSRSTRACTARTRPTLPDGPRRGRSTRAPAFYSFYSNYYVGPGRHALEHDPGRTAERPLRPDRCRPPPTRAVMATSRCWRMNRASTAMAPGAAADQPATGFEPGTPVSLIGDSGIQQITRGLTVQGNWNLPTINLVGRTGPVRHRGRLLQLPDARPVRPQPQTPTLDPDHIDEGYVAATRCISNNDFGGTHRAGTMFASAHLHAHARVEPGGRACG